MTDDLKDELKNILSKKSSYSTSDQDTQELKDITTKITSVASSIESTMSSDQATIVAIYDLLGNRIDKISKGVNIIQMSDGTSKKVFIR